MPLCKLGQATQRDVDLGVAVQVSSAQKRLDGVDYDEFRLRGVGQKRLDGGQVQRQVKKAD
jgi:hypothetical protein